MSGYNGWKNYETWAAALWINNDQGEQEYWQDGACEAFTDANKDREEAISLLANRLEEYHEENTPTVMGLYADLLNAALGEVDWFEIAETFIKEIPDDGGDNE